MTGAPPPPLTNFIISNSSSISIFTASPFRNPAFLYDTILPKILAVKTEHMSNRKIRQSVYLRALPCTTPATRSGRIIPIHTANKNCLDFDPIHSHQETSPSAEFLTLGKSIDPIRPFKRLQ
ncbi:hypothetical protein MLD38_002399 [Melastoma candidum]|uniref:Uncharacterized protein n=1 Tax=Melastoma candidum TaxID=119954 RepID=A0ACB9S2Y5_9MYRT|nr:hypothetical protein MLD38_002399 [Melastoma candidum]